VLDDCVSPRALDCASFPGNIMRLTNLSIAVLLLGVLPLFFLDLSRWVVDIPPELHDFAHGAFFGFLALLLMELPGLRQSPFVWRAR
jgi:hypothetical protein